MEIDELLAYGVYHKASDVHITVGTVPIVRINGVLTPIEGMPIVVPSDTEGFASKMCEDTQLEVLSTKGQVDFSYVVESVGRYRINIFKQRGTYAIVARTIALTIPTFEQLKLPETLKDFTKLRKGLVLVTGPTGSGKSTTLASMIDLINKNRKEHIVTLEDPIEYLHKHHLSIVNQREMGLDSDGYGNALRAALREDPDIILVGEMRDLETISTAITAAETGHVVFSTLHTIGAAKTIDRIIDVFPTNQQQQVRIQLAAVLQGVISQQLLHTRDSRGRVAALEIMKVNSAIRNLIRENKSHQIDNIIQTNGRLGMQTMNVALVNLFRQGFITVEDVMTYCTDVEEVKKLIGTY